MYESLLEWLHSLIIIVFNLQETVTHCIMLNSNPVCPGTLVDVDQQVTIQAGFIDDSADQQYQLPAWKEETYPRKKIINQPVPGRSDDILKVTYKEDNCLYIRVQIYPNWFAIAPPVALDVVTNVVTLGHGTNLNYNDQREFSGKPKASILQACPR